MKTKKRLEKMIKFFASKELGYCNVKNKSFCEKLEITERQLQRLLLTLEAEKKIKRVQDGTRKIYWIGEGERGKEESVMNEEHSPPADWYYDWMAEI